MFVRPSIDKYFSRPDDIILYGGITSRQEYKEYIQQIQL